MKLTKPQKVVLARIAELHPQSAGFFDTLPERNLILKGLIERADKKTIYTDYVSFTAILCRLTEAGKVVARSI